MVHVGPAFILFVSVAAGLALVTYVYMDAEGRYEARRKRAWRRDYLADEYRWMKEDLGVDPEGVLDNEAEYYQIYETIENSADHTEEDRRELLKLLEDEYERGMSPSER
jgi:hypothetical protein